MHEGVDLLHAPLDAVVVEVRPVHVRGCRAARHARPQPLAHHRAPHHGAKVLVARRPLRLDVLDFVAVAQHHLVELRRVQDGEIKLSGPRRNVAHQVHPRLEAVADGGHDHRLDDVARAVGEHAAHEVRARNAREADTLPSFNAHPADGVGGVGAVRGLHGGPPAHDLVSFPEAAGGRPYLLQCDHRGFRTLRLVVRAVGAVAAVVFVVEVVVHPFEPEERLVHHPVALRAVQLGGGAVFLVACVGVVVGVPVVQGVEGHLPVRVVDRGLHPGDGDGATRRFFGDFRQHPAPLRQDGRDVPARDVGVAVLVPGLVVEVADVGVVSHGVVELDHGVLRLPDVQLVEVFRKGGEGLVVQVPREFVRADQLAPGVRGVPGGVDAAKARLLPLPQVAPVALQLHARDPDMFQFAAKGEQLLERRHAVDQGAVLHPKAREVPLVVEGDPAPGEILHGAQRKRLEVGGQVQLVHRRPLGEGDRAQRRAARGVHLLQPVAAAQVQTRKVHIVHHVQSPQHGQLRAQNQFREGVGVRAVAQRQFLQHGQGGKAHVREAAPVREVQFFHPLPSVQMEDGADVGHLAVSVTPLLVFLHGVVGHGVALPPELEVKVTGRGGPHRRARRRVALERDVGGRVLARRVAGVEQAHAVRHPPMAVRLAVSLHGFQIGVFHVGHRSVVVHLHAQRLRLDVFVLRVQVVDPLAEPRALLVVEHGEDGGVRHFLSYALVRRRQFLRELLPQVLPKHRVVPGVGVHRLVLRRELRIRGVFVHVPGVFQTPVVAHAQNRVAVVEDEVAPHSPHRVLHRPGLLLVPEAEHHVLHPLVHAPHDVREHVVVAQVCHVEVVRQLGLEFRPVVQGRFHPLHRPLQVFRPQRPRLESGVAVVVVRVSRLENFQPVWNPVVSFRVKIVVEEHAHSVVVVEELPALRGVLPAEFLRHPRLVVITRDVAEPEHRLRALVVVEVEFP